MTGPDDGATAALPARPTTRREHFDQTRHTVIEILGTPWYCQDCPVKSPLYGLTVTHQKARPDAEAGA